MEVGQDTIPYVPGTTSHLGLGSSPTWCLLSMNQICDCVSKNAAGCQEDEYDDTYESTLNEGHQVYESSRHFQLHKIHNFHHHHNLSIVSPRTYLPIR